jgi:CRISPR-associated protein Cmr2
MSEPEHPHGSMLLISLGPIQDFIHSARRCQDLWFGSWLLSELARTAGHAVSAAAGGPKALIFPAGLAAQATRDGQEQAGVSNLIFALLPPGARPDAVAAAARAQMQGRLDQLAGASWSPGEGADPQVQALWDQHFHRQNAKAQVDDLMEWLWVSLPRTGPGNSTYAADRQELYARLAAVKNTKAWTQPPWRPGPGIPKSGLDGDRESVLDEAIFAVNPATKAPRYPVELRRRAFGIKKAERLCGVGLLKRRGQDLDGEFKGGKPPFHSTSHIAAGPVLQALQGHRSAAVEYVKQLENLGLDIGRFQVKRANHGGPSRLADQYDGSLLFESRLTDHFEENSSLKGASNVATAVKKASLTLRDLRTAAKLPEPSPYYAFLIADGDNMGKAIDALTTPEAHHRLAADLNGFAACCRQTVEGHGGSLIFAGGDDVMALLPLHTALECSRELADSFAAAMGSYGAEGERPTLSVGLGVSHAREAMSDARGLAARAEKTAKEGGKNALCVIVAKRSGGDTRVVGSWHGGNQAVDARLHAWVTLLQAGALSAKTAHDLEEAADHYAGLTAAEQRTAAAEINALCRQVLGRKRQRGGTDRQQREDDPVEKLLGPILARTSETGGRGPVAVVRQLSHELQIARLFAQAKAHAAGEALDLDGRSGAGTNTEDGES